MHHTGTILTRVVVNAVDGNLPALGVLQQQQLVTALLADINRDHLNISSNILRGQKNNTLQDIQYSYIDINNTCPSSPAESIW